VFAVLGTVSRGGIISLGVVLILAGVFSGHGRRSGTIAVLVAVALSAGLYVVAIAPSQVRQRITQSDGGAGRSDLWTIGWRMVQHDPLTGVGAGNFPISSVHYLLRPGTITRSDFIVDNPKVAHNMYLEIPAELGIIGLGLFLSIIGFSLRCGIRASQRFALAGDRDMEILARAFVLGACGMLTANLFISQQFNKPLWLLLSIGPALLAFADRETAELRTEAAA
jgi:O-antigen ligase